MMLYNHPALCYVLASDLSSALVAGLPVELQQAPTEAVWALKPVDAQYLPQRFSNHIIYIEKAKQI